MNRLTQFTALLTCICLLGCATTGLPADQKDNDAYVHPASKFSFPKRINNFKFAGVIRYAHDDSDISVGYNSPTPTVATVYVYPAPKNMSVPEGSNANLID